MCTFVIDIGIIVVNIEVMLEIRTDAIKNIINGHFLLQLSSHYFNVILIILFYYINI